MSQKVFATVDAQIQKLQSRGLQIQDTEAAKKIILSENYYSLVNGYKDVFLACRTTAATEERYRESASFSDLYALYCFDRELRHLFLKYLLEIENHVRTVVSHVFSEAYGHDNYLKFENFKEIPSTLDETGKIQQIKEISAVIGEFQRVITDQLSKNNPMISHYMLHHGYVPLWVLVNRITFGNLSRFYAVMKRKDQNTVCRQFSCKLHPKMQPEELKSILKILTIYRNIAAHGTRLYNTQTDKYIPNFKKIHGARELSIPKFLNGNYRCGKKDLFSVVIVFKIMLSEEAFKAFFVELKRIVKTMEDGIQPIFAKEIQKKMGFPEKWKAIADLEKRAVVTV